MKYKRYKGKKERRRWTEVVNKRMTTISTDWKSVSVAGANAAIRNSIAIGSRSSTFSFGAIRPSSTFAVECGDDEKRSVPQMRTGVGLHSLGSPISTDRVFRMFFAPDTRISRSFTADSRPSGESRRTRAFHIGYVPPIPSLPDTDSTSWMTQIRAPYRQHKVKVNGPSPPTISVSGLLINIRDLLHQMRHQIPEMILMRLCPL